MTQTEMDYAALIKEARAVLAVVGMRQSTILIDRLADAVEALVAERDYANACLKAASHKEVEYGGQLDRAARELSTLRGQLAAAEATVGRVLHIG